MLYVLAIVFGAVVGLAAGGKLSNILNFKLEKMWIILIAFAVQISSQILCYNGFKFFADNSLIIHGLVFLFMFIAFWANRHYLGVLLVGIGCVLNALVMMVNGGKMPVDPKVIEAAGLPAEAIQVISSGLDSKHILIDETTRLTFLADIIHPPSFLGILMQVVSIGDLVVGVGVFILAFEVITGRKIISHFSIKRRN